MKKIVSLFIILSLMLSLFSCFKSPTEDNAIPENFVTENNENTGELEKEQQNTDEDETNHEKSKDKAAHCDVTIDEPFSDFEVVVSFTLEESAKDLEYFPEDFPEVDCFNVYLFDYYPEEVHPEYKDRKTVILMLNEQSKQGVLDAVKILEKDDRVYSAEPNYYGAVIGEKNYFYISTNKYLYEYEESGTLENLNDAFDIDGVEKVSTLQMQEYKFCKYSIHDFIYKVSCEKFDLDILKAFSKDERVKHIMYTCETLEMFRYLIITMHTQSQYTAEDFVHIEGLKEFKLNWKESNEYEATFEHICYQNLTKAYFDLLNDERVKSVEVKYKSEYLYVLP